ncbi:MAG: hypothetical protein QM601_00630 [Pseudoxanthomonas sp.]
MRNWHGSSHASAPCRLEWRPSRWLAGALMALGLLAGVAVLACNLPAPLAWLLAPALAIHGGLSARRLLRAPPAVLVLAATREGVCTLDGVPLATLRVQWRGPLAFLTCTTRDGTRTRLAFWPDTLPAPARRELRLAAGGPAASPGAAGMAP